MESLSSTHMVAVLAALSFANVMMAFCFPSAAEESSREDTDPQKLKKSSSDFLEVVGAMLVTCTVLDMMEVVMVLGGVGLVGNWRRRNQVDKNGNLRHSCLHPSRPAAAAWRC